MFSKKKRERDECMSAYVCISVRICLISTLEHIQRYQRVKLWKEVLIRFGICKWITISLHSNEEWEITIRLKYESIVKLKMLPCIVQLYQIAIVLESTILMMMFILADLLQLIFLNTSIRIFYNESLIRHQKIGNWVTLYRKLIFDDAQINNSRKIHKEVPKSFLNQLQYNKLPIIFSTYLWRQMYIYRRINIHEKLMI